MVNQMRERLPNTDPGFWKSGLELVAAELEEAEAAAEEILGASS